MIDFVILAAVVAVGAILGIAIGMLLARRIFRWSERGDEDPGDRDD